MPGAVGARSPVCTSCGSPNPKPLTEDEWEEVLYRSYHYAPNPFVVNALDEHAPGWRERERLRIEERDARFQYLLTNCRKCRKGLHEECEGGKCKCEHTLTVTYELCRECSHAKGLHAGRGGCKWEGPEGCECDLTFEEE
jgi:hypothetical protein